jgi:hypothetical protein
MTNEQLIEKFNPAHGSNMTAEDLETLRGLSDAQIDVLADAYPNKPTRRVYLRLFDTTLPANKQLFQLSTWQNLRNLRKFSNKKNLRPYDFLASATSLNQQRQATAARPTGSSPVKKQVVDLTAKEAADELKNAVAKQKAQSPAAEPEKVKVAATKPPVKPAAGKGKTAPGGAPADQEFIDVDNDQPTP